MQIQQEKPPDFNIVNDVAILILRDRNLSNLSMEKNIDWICWTSPYIITTQCGNFEKTNFEETPRLVLYLVLIYGEIQIYQERIYRVVAALWVCLTQDWSEKQIQAMKEKILTSKSIIKA